MGLSLTVKGQRELQKLAEDLRRAKGTLRRELVQAFKTAGEATLKRVKHNIETNAIKGRRTGRKPPFAAVMPGTNIRSRISRVTELDISSSAGDPHVRFQVQSGRLGDASSLPFHIENGRWRHPIMGNRSSWAAQTGSPWFYDEIKSDIRLFEDECDKAIDKTIRTLEG